MMHLGLLGSLPQVSHNPGKLSLLPKLHVTVNTRPPNERTKELLLLSFAINLVRLHTPAAY